MDTSGKQKGMHSEIISTLSCRCLLEFTQTAHRNPDSKDCSASRLKSQKIWTGHQFLYNWELKKIISSPFSRRKKKMNLLSKETQTH